MPMVFSPRWSEGTGMLRPLVGSKWAVGQGVLTIVSFANMTVPTLTHGPATGTIVPGSTMLSEVEGTLSVSTELARIRGQLQSLYRRKALRSGCWSMVPMNNRTRMVPTTPRQAAEKHEEPREYQQ